MGDERRGVNPARLYQGKDFGTIATVHPSGLERQVLPVHVRQRQQLGLVIKRHNRHDGIGTGTLPGQSETVLTTGHLQHHVRPSMGTMAQHKVFTAFGSRHLHPGIVFAHETQPLLRPFANDDAMRIFQHDTLQSAYPRGACADNQHRVLFLDFRDTRRPKACGQDVAHEQSLLVGHRRGNHIQALVRIRNPDKFGLSSVDAATQSPSAMRVGAVVHVSVSAKEAFPAKYLHVYGHPVARLDRSDFMAYFFHHPDHFMPYRDSRYGTRHTPMFDV